MLQGDYDIGYHYVVRRDGTIEHCRPTDVVGNHAEGYNLHSIGICIIGGRAGKTTRSENNYTDRQLESLRILLVSLQSEHDAAEVLGHDQLPGVRHTCPGFDVRDWYNKGIN